MEELVWACDVCDEVMKKRTPAIACKKCLSWLHLTCTGKKQKELMKIAKEFTCQKCLKKVKIVLFTFLSLMFSIHFFFNSSKF